jgi:NAD-dependent SIR2 family protein deacetylase
MKYAFFFGAGASKSCGAPLQGELFKEYFKVRQQKWIDRKAMDDEYDIEREIATLFSFLFGIDVDNGNLDNIIFPTFEEVLGLIDIAIMRRQAFKCFEGAHHNLNAENRLEKCRQYLIYLMASILYDKLDTNQNNHTALIVKLNENKVLFNSVLISTNYDLLLDNAIFEVLKVSQNNYGMDYGFDFANYHPINNKKKVSLYKLHGSLNWLYCPVCDVMSWTANEKGAIYLIRKPTLSHKHILCDDCKSIKEMVIVPPTYFKDYTNYYLNRVWHSAEQELREADKIIFCGYSFPDADMHIKYLLKRVETNRGSKPLQIIVANNHDKKSQYEKEEEEKRFKRFFIGPVNYTEEDFISFTQNIEKYL